MPLRPVGFPLEDVATVASGSTSNKRTRSVSGRTYSESNGQESGSNLAPGEAQTLRLSLSTWTSYSSSSTLKNTATASFSSLARCELSIKRTVPSFSPGFEQPLAVGEVMSPKDSSRGLVIGSTDFLPFESKMPFATLAPLVMDFFL